MLQKIVLLEARTNGYWNYRVPGILCTKNGVVLVTAEARRGRGGIHHVAALVGVLIGGPVSDALALKVTGGRLRIQTVAMFLGAAAIVYMSLGSTLWAACAGMALFGLFRGFYESNTHASLFEVIEPKYRASAVGALVMAAFLIGAAAPWLMGVLCDHGLSMSSVFAGYSLAYIVGGLAVGLGLLAFYRRDRIVEDVTA